ncbi:hypothetical protein VE02_01271 [Pseudogymnoascus sp. 03VT05]|nr:hypothetical protein VE02_01271 [Pseudogymnoascus sp. 03VT05]
MKAFSLVILLLAGRALGQQLFAFPPCARRELLYRYSDSNRVPRTSAKPSTTSAEETSTSSTDSATDPASGVHTSVSSTAASSTGTSTSLGSSSPVSKNGLSTGAKAGIAIGAVGIVLIALLVVFLVRRRRNRVSKNNDIYDAPETKETGPSTPLGGWPRPHTGVQELPSKEPTDMIARQELSTAANDLELESPKGDAQPGGAMQRSELPTPANMLEHSATVAELQSPAWDSGQVQEPAFRPPNQLEHELDAHVDTEGPLQSPDSHSHPLPQQTFSQPFESFEPAATKLLSTQHEPVSLGASGQTILSDTSTAEGSSSQIDTLLAKREKIRVEKERLLKLQELDEMEAMVNREILEERARGVGPPR